jgi:ribosomal protein L6P/L9E
MKKTFLLNQFLQYTFYKSHDKYFICKSDNKNFFIQLPSQINVKVEKDCVHFFVKEKAHLSTFDQFISNLESFLKLENKDSFVKRIKISGLGYKVIKENGELSFSLGYSSPIKTKIPEYITDVIIKKNLLVLKSFNKVFLGNFVSLLSNIKGKDVYKGKGLSLEYSSSKLKPIKKK